MPMKLVACVFLLVFQSSIFVQIQATETCYYRDDYSNNVSTVTCDSSCCSRQVASSAQSACCSSFSWSTIAIVFFVIVGVCILIVCLIYCRPLWKACCCNHWCPCASHARVSSSRDPSPATENPTFVVNNDDLPDYSTIAKHIPVKDITPPPYNYVTEHPTDFGIGARVPSAPPVYQSRRGSVATVVSMPRTES